MTWACRVTDRPVSACFECLGRGWVAPYGFATLHYVSEAGPSSFEIPMALCPRCGGSGREAKS